MKRIVPCGIYPEMTDFPYAVPKWKYGCTKKEHDLLHSILFTMFDDAPGMEVVYDFDGLQEWYDTHVPEDEKAEYHCPTVYDWLESEIGRAVTPLKKVSMIPVVFINCTIEPYIADIMCRLKEYETRNRNTLGRFLGERVLLAETGHGDPIVKCSVRIDEIISVRCKEDWDGYLGQTWVPVGSKHDWQPDTKVKWLYSLTDVQPITPFRLPRSCRRHGRVWAEYEGGI